MGETGDVHVYQVGLLERWSSTNADRYPTLAANHHLDAPDQDALFDQAVRAFLAGLDHDVRALDTTTSSQLITRRLLTGKNPSSHL